MGGGGGLAVFLMLVATNCSTFVLEEWYSQQKQSQKCIVKKLCKQRLRTVEYDWLWVLPEFLSRRRMAREAENRKIFFHQELCLKSKLVLIDAFHILRIF